MDNDAAIAWAIDELVRQIGFRSISDHEHEMAAYLVERFDALGFPVAREPIPGAGPNVVVRWDGVDTPPDLLLTAHTAGHGVSSMRDNRQQSVDQVLRFLDGMWPTALVNPEVKPRARAGRLRES